MRFYISGVLQDLMIETERLSSPGSEETSGPRMWQLVDNHHRAYWSFDLDATVAGVLRDALAGDHASELWRLSDGEVKAMSIDRIQSGRWQLYSRVKHVPAAVVGHASGSSVESPAPVAMAPDAGMRSTGESASHRSTTKTQAPVARLAEQVKLADNPTAEKRHWIEIELVGEDDKPIPNEAYRLRLPDGRLVEGFLDSNGFARIAELPKGGACEVCFPQLDGAAWDFLASRPSRAPV